MTGIRKNIWENLKDKVFRKTYKEEQIKNGVAFQIRAMREARNWSQNDLAKRTGKAQSAIARIEDPDYGKFSLQTLLEVADAFDVWLSVQFTSFSVGLERTANLSPTALNAVSFELDWPTGSRPETRSGNAVPTKLLEVANRLRTPGPRLQQRSTTELVWINIENAPHKFSGATATGAFV